jgi:soluble lytic murein transglycosylase-like protein
MLSIPFSTMLFFCSLWLNPAQAGDDKRYIYQYRLSPDPIEQPRKKSKLEKLKKLAQQAAINHQIPPRLFLALVQQESNWKPHAVSRRGATGLTQLMPQTAKTICNLSKTDLKDPQKNLNCGAKYLAKQIKRFGYIRQGLCAFNAGPATVEKLGRCPRYKETQHYVNKLMAVLDS